MNTTTSTTDTPTPSLSDTFRSTRRKPRGKIAELPKTIRDLVNQLLDDGASYRTIRIELAKHGVKLNGENISNWFDSGSGRTIFEGAVHRSVSAIADSLKERADPELAATALLPVSW